MPGAVQLDDDALNLEGVEFSRTEDGEADGDDDGGFRRDFGGGGEAAPVEEADQPEEEEAAEEVCVVRVSVCVCVFIKLNITAQSGPLILVILCHSH